MNSGDWNPDLYQGSHSFVWQYGRDLVGLLAPQPGERILDVGCGTGQLTGEIARAGAEPTGIDISPSMIEQARANFPAIRFELQDVCAMPYRGEFDAVFSNAALHWVRQADDAAAAIARALKPGRPVRRRTGRPRECPRVAGGRPRGSERNRGRRSGRRESMVLSRHRRVRRAARAP